MAQALHGGGILSASKKFGIPVNELVDFSSNLNVLAPAIDEPTWCSWFKEIERYPEADPTVVASQIANLYDIDSAHVLPTNGASEALYLVARLFSGFRIGVLEPAFSDYTRAFEGTTVERVEHYINPKPISELIHQLEPVDVVVIGNPNNPTGTLWDRRELMDLMGHHWSKPKHWIIDEAFIEFTADAGNNTLIQEIERLPSVIVLRSLTKTWKIPGLRLGFVVTTRMMPSLRLLQPPWSLNGMAQAWATTCLTKEMQLLLQQSLVQLQKLKKNFFENLSSIQSIRPWPSAANFILIELLDPKLKAISIYEAMGQRGVLVRLCDSFLGMQPERFIRIAVRNEIDNHYFVESLREVCNDLTRRAA